MYSLISADTNAQRMFEVDLPDEATLCCHQTSLCETHTQNCVRVCFTSSVQPAYEWNWFAVVVFCSVLSSFLTLTLCTLCHVTHLPAFVSHLSPEFIIVV